MTADQAMEILRANDRLAKGAIERLVQALPEGRDCECQAALASALMTRLDQVPPEVVERLRPILARYLE